MQLCAAAVQAPQAFAHTRAGCTPALARPARFLSRQAGASRQPAARPVRVSAVAEAPARLQTVKKPAFPFTRLAGQEEMKLALLLNVVDPSIGGVLIMGDRGTGKSVAVRSLVDLLPMIDVVKDDPFNSHPTGARAQRLRGAGAARRGAGAAAGSGRLAAAH